MKGKLLTFGVSLLAMATIGVVQLQTKAVDGSRDCDQYAVMRCGALNRKELIAEYESNNGSNANGDSTVQGDIKKVFTAMGISRADLDSRVEAGVVYRDGTVKVGDKVVATDAVMAARGLGGAQIAGTNAQKVSVSAMSDAQTAMVFYKDGKFAFAVMKPCANPVTATPRVEPPKPEPQPKAECVSLKVIEQKPSAEYAVTATAQVSGGATIESYTFKLYRGTSEVMNKTYPSTADTQSLVYAVSSPGEYKVVASVKTSEGVKKGTQCKATFTIPQPPTPQTPGVNIEKYVDNNKKYTRVNANVEFSYRIVVTNTGSTDLDNVLVTDTAETGISLLSVSPPGGVITPPSGTNTKYTFAYTIPKLLKGEARTFILTAKVPAYKAGKLPNTVCVDAPAVPGNPDKCDTAEVEVPPTPVPGKIEACVINEKVVRQVSEEDVKANPTLYTTDLTQCNEKETPEELPQTGPAEMVLSVAGAMSLAGASAYYVASRRQING